MANWQNEMFKIGGAALNAVIDSLASAAKSELTASTQALDGGGNFQNVAAALEKTCVRSQRISANGWAGEFALGGERVLVHVMNVGGQTVLVNGEPMHLPLETVQGRLATYLLLRNGLNSVGAWQGRESAGGVDLNCVARVPMPHASVESLAQSILAVGSERINLQKMFGG